MLEEILVDCVTTTQAENHPPFAATIDYEAEVKKRDMATSAWATQSKDDRAKFDNKLEQYLLSEGVMDLKDPSILPSKNYYLLQREITARVSAENLFQPLPIDELHFENALVELVENIENVSHISRPLKNA